VSVEESVAEGVAGAVDGAIVVVVIVVLEAELLQKICVEAAGAVEVASGGVGGGAHVRGRLGRVAVRASLCGQALGDPALEVSGAGTSTVVLNPSVEVEDSAGVGEVVAVGAVDDLDLEAVVPIAVPLALVKVDGDVRARLGSSNEQVVEEAEHVAQEGIVSREQDQLGGGGRRAVRLREVLVHDGGIVDGDSATEHLRQLDEELLVLPGLQGGDSRGARKASISVSVDSDLVVFELSGSQRDAEGVSVLLGCFDLIGDQVQLISGGGGVREEDTQAGEVGGLQEGRDLAFQGHSVRISFDRADDRRDTSTARLTR